MNYISKRILTSIVLIIIIYLSLKNLFILFFSLFLINLISIDEFKVIFKNIFKNNTFNLFLSILLIVTYLTFFSFLIWFYLIQGVQANIFFIILLLFICASTDIGGYICGKLIGGKKLTKISPNKTYSGMIGSFIFSITFGYLFYHINKNIFTFDINIFYIILIISFISQIGDLMISFLKRKANIKDTGSILPGHGGILDRIDGILIAIPAGIMLLSI